MFGRLRHVLLDFVQLLLCCQDMEMFSSSTKLSIALWSLLTVRWFEGSLETTTCARHGVMLGSIIPSGKSFVISWSINSWSSLLKRLGLLAIGLKHRAQLQLWAFWPSYTLRNSSEPNPTYMLDQKQFGGRVACSPGVVGGSKVIKDRW